MSAAAPRKRLAASLRQWLAAALHLPVAYRRMALVGWALYAISWLTPSVDARQIGAVGFIAALRFAFRLSTAATPWGIPLGACVLFGWLANISIFARMPPWARAIWIAAPWVAFTVVLLLLPVRPSIPRRALFFLYFYPWAAGIALIHLAHIAAALRHSRRRRLERPGRSAAARRSTH